MNRLPIINLGPTNLYENCINWTEANMHIKVSDFNKEFNQRINGNPKSYLKAAVQMKNKKNNLLLKILKGVNAGDISYSEGLKQVQLLSNATLKECMNFLRLKEFLPSEGKKKDILDAMVKDAADSLNLKFVKEAFKKLI